MKIVRAVLPAIALFAAAAAQAQITNDAVKLGVMTDFSSIYADYSGKGHVIATQLAVEEFGGAINGKKIEVLQADFQNKADVAMAIARKWFDEDNVDVVIDAPNSGIAGGLISLVKDKNKVYLVGAVSSDLTGKFCSPNHVQFTPDTYSFASVAGAALVQKGLKSWFTITADYAMGHAMERDSLAQVSSGGGESKGTIRHPFGAQDMSSFVLQAQGSKAQVLSFASAGADLQNLLKSANEFGVHKTMQLVALNMELLDAYKADRAKLAGLYVTEGWYWDQDDRNREFARRFNAQRQLYPSRGAAAIYSMTRAYLQAVQDLNADGNGAAIVAKMKSQPLNDLYARGGRIREDGRLIKEMYMAQLKAPSESKGPWDVYNIVGTVPGEKAFKPVAQSECPLLKKS
jgi:branched-chain amino acid transport system substrate-binding protein